MYSNSLARHFSPVFHAKCLLPRLDKLLPVRSWLKYFYQWCYTLLLRDTQGINWKKKSLLCSTAFHYKDVICTLADMLFDEIMLVKFYKGQMWELWKLPHFEIMLKFFLQEHKNQ